LDQNDSDDLLVLQDLANGQIVDLRTLMYNPGHFQHYKEWVIVTKDYFLGYIGTVSDIQKTGNKTDLKYIPSGKVFIWDRFHDKKSGINFAYLTQYKKL
jgi:hypothetical protein